MLQNECHRETGHCFFSFPSFANATRNPLRGIIGRHETFFGGTFQMQSSETCVMECAKTALVCRAHSGEFVISYPRTQIFFGQNMKIHVYLGPVAIRMCWFLCCFTTEKKFQSWGVRAERSREGLRSAHLLGSCASGMAGSKILTHMPKTTGHAPSGHKTE